MNFHGPDGIPIEIDDDIWDAVDAIVALVCEVNGEQYFGADDTEVSGQEKSPECSEILSTCETKDTKSVESERSRVLATTKFVVWSIIEAVSGTFPRLNRQTLTEAKEAISSNVNVMVENDIDALVPAGPYVDNAEILEAKPLKTKLQESVSEKSQPISKQMQDTQLDIGSFLPDNKLNVSNVATQHDDEFKNLSSTESESSSCHEQLPSILRLGAHESKVVSLSQATTKMKVEGESLANIDVDGSVNSIALQNGRVSRHKMHFVCENDSKFEAQAPGITRLLLNFATGSKRQPSYQSPLKVASSHHANLPRIVSSIRFSCYENDKNNVLLFSGISLLHVSCATKDTFDESVYDEIVDAGCNPEEESLNGCNVYAFAACQENFRAMRHISFKHSRIWRSTLCESRNAGRNLLHCILDYADPSTYKSIFESLGPTVCTDLCKTIKLGVVSPLFLALKHGNYAFLQSISKQVHIWNFTTTDLGYERTFLFTMMTNLHAQSRLLEMLANISSLESFVIDSSAGAKNSSMMFQTYQMGHMSIASHVLKQQHLLYFLELDKIHESLDALADEKLTRTSLTKKLSCLLEKHQSNTVVLWHIIHLVISLSHDEEMALDLVSTGNLDAVKHHHHWRSFDRFTGESALHVAARKDWTEILSCLCDLGHDINPFCFMMRTPMHTSAFHNSVKSIMLLNNMGAEASVESGDGKSPIACSIETMNIEASMEILSKVGCRKSLFRTDAKGLSPLMRALASKQLQVAHKILKQHPEQANFVSMNGTNIFHAAAPHLASLQQLVSWSSLEHKDIWAFLQQKNNDGETPKDIAAHCGYLDSLRFFLQIYQSKGSINGSKYLQEMDVHYSESKDAFSQVDFASPVSVLKFLSNHSESINCHDFYHRTPFILAVQAKNLQGSQDLVDAGVDILQCDALGNSAMHYMFLSKREQSLWMWEEPTTSDTDPSDVLQCILQRNSEDNVAKCLTLKNKAGITPFCLAIMNEFYFDVALLCGEVKFPKYLLNVQLPNGTYCLHIACSKNLISLVVLFLNLGSDPSVFDSNGMSPEYIARSHGFNSITLIIMQFCNALKIQCAVRGYLCRVHALANRSDCIAVQNVVFKLIENPNTILQQYRDLNANFPLANWNSMNHPTHLDMVPMAYAAM